MRDKDQEILADLLADWELARAEQSEVTPEQLCEPHPHLLEPLRESIRLLKDTAWMTESTSSSALQEESELRQVSVEEVIRRIADFNLLSEKDTQTLADVSNQSAEQLTGDLVQQGKLTLYQKKSLLGVNHFPLVIDRYTIIDFLGAGGMGIVFKAKHQEMNRVVAIKTLAGGPRDNKNRMERFVREIKSLAQLTHPNIVGAHDALSWNDQLYLVMEFADGLDLGALIRNHGKLEPAESVTVIAQVASAIRFAHENGIIHRDIKPENIVVGTDGKTKLLDLGLAKIKSDHNELTQASGVLGTPNFVAPEMLEEQIESTEAADIYSLGCTLFFALTGKPPFEKESPIKTLLAHQQEPVPSLPDGLEHRESLQAIVNSMMSKKAADRPTAGQVQESLAQTGIIKSTINIYYEPVAENTGQEFVPEIQLKTPGAKHLEGPESNKVIALPRSSHAGIVFGAIGVVLLAAILWFVIYGQGGETGQAQESIDLKIAKWVLSYDSCAVEIQTDVGLQTTTNIENLPTSNFKITGIQLYAPTDPPDFGAMAELSELRWISLSDFAQGDVRFDGLAKIQNLKQLYIEACVVDDAALASISKLTKLETLDLSVSRMAVKNFPESGLSKLTGLRDLLLAFTELTDDELQNLKIPESVETLDLQETNLSKKSVAELSRLSKLKNLAIGGPNAGDGFIDLLPSLPKLNDLNFANSQISVRFLEALVDFKSISSLHIYDVGADDSWMEALVQLDQLRELDIADNDFTEKGILRFAEMKNLRSITVGGLASVSEEALDQLQDLMPNCEFYE